MNQLNKIVWLVETLRKFRKISYIDLNQKWKESEQLSGGLDLSKRTLHKWIDDIFNTFGIIVSNEGRGEYCYYLENPDCLCNGHTEEWLYNTTNVNNILIENKGLSNRIILENIPSGLVFFDDIMTAMKQCKRIRMVYHDYYEDSNSLLIINPYVLRLWHQRWYIIAYSNNTDKIRRFCLDRIVDLNITDENYHMPEDFSSEEYFRDCFGVMSDDYGPDATRVLLKATAFQANYIRDLPLHESQKEIERNEQYSVFELNIRPFYDFYQEVLRMGTQVEILEPNYMREELCNMTRIMYNMYNK